MSAPNPFTTSHSSPKQRNGKNYSPWDEQHSSSANEGLDFVVPSPVSFPSNIDESNQTNNNKWRQQQQEMTPFSKVVSSTSMEQQDKRLSEDSPLFERIASNFKRCGSWTSALPDTPVVPSSSSPILSAIDRPEKSPMNFVGVGAGISVGDGVNGSNTFTPKKKEFLMWERPQKHTPGKERSMNKSSKHSVRQPNWTAPPIPVITKGGANNNTKGNMEVSKIATALSQLSSLKKRWNPPTSKDKINLKKVSKRKNQHEKRKLKRCVDGKKKQRCDNRTPGGFEKWEKVELTMDSGVEKDQVPAVVDQSPAADNHIVVCNRSVEEEDEEMDISDDEEDDMTGSKYPSSGDATFSRNVTCEEGEIVLNPKVQEEKKGHVSQLASMTRLNDATYPGLSPTSAIPDNVTKLPTNEEVLIDLYNPSPVAKMTMHTPTTLWKKHVTKIENATLKEAIVDLYAAMPKTALCKPTNLQEKQAMINSAVPTMPEKKIIKPLNDLSNEDDEVDLYIDLYPEMSEAKMTIQKPVDVPEKQTKESLQKEKAKGSDLVAPSVNLVNNACYPTSTIVPTFLRSEQPKLDFPTTPTIPAHSESLAYKKARLARQLNKAKIGKAKAKLRMAQIKKRDALRAKITREVKEPDANISSTPGSRSISLKENTREYVDTPPFGKKTAMSTECKRIADVTAFKMSTLIISGIAASGARERVRPILPEMLVDGEDCERRVKGLQPTEEALQMEGTSTIATTSSKVMASPSIENVSSSLSLEEQIDKSNRRKLDLKLKKIRLQVKILEKTQAKKKRKVESKKLSDLPPNHENAMLCGKKVFTELGDLTTIENEKYKLEILLEDKNEAESNTLTTKSISIALPVDAGNPIQDNVKPISFEVCTHIKGDLCRERASNLLDSQQMQGHEATDSSDEVLRKEEVMSKLRERQIILKENISTSREVNKELKYEKGVSDLALLVERQRKMLKYHGEKIGQNKTSLQKCSEQLREEKECINASEKKLQVFLKRKKVMESMVFSATTKLIDCRRKRRVMLKLLGEKMAK